MGKEIGNPVQDDFNKPKNSKIKAQTSESDKKPSDVKKEVEKKGKKA